MRWQFWLIFVPVAVVVIALSVVNRDPVTFSIGLGSAWQVPLFLLLLAAALLGILFGAAARHWELRVVHACGMVEVASRLAWQGDPAAAGRRRRRVSERGLPRRAHVAGAVAGPARASTVAVLYLFSFGVCCLCVYCLLRIVRIVEDWIQEASTRPEAQGLGGF